jgi:hypothetical protein
MPPEPAEVAPPLLLPELELPELPADAPVALDVPAELGLPPLVIPVEPLVPPDPPGVPPSGDEHASKSAHPASRQPRDARVLARRVNAWAALTARRARS